MDSSSTESLIGQYSGRPSQLLLSRSRSLSRQPNTPRHIPTPPGWLNSYIRAELAIKLEASRLLILHAARVLDRGEEAKKEGRVAKLYATETAFEVAHESLQRCTRKWADLHDVTGRFCVKLRDTLVDFMLQANRQRPRLYVHC
ncbi:acyl-CoA dehydrogenase [Candidatus Bathyarchaeota archaeon]|nr:MAG: acyl-CoA dehydrogenase [Candidatus Bathyarchaeota archaeon]TMI59278.1 MAG: acyl-CoA dehydrogenase [Candidatus Bathyarchaeota archaeon]